MIDPQNGHLDRSIYISLADGRRVLFTTMTQRGLLLGSVDGRSDVKVEEGRGHTDDGSLKVGLGRRRTPGGQDIGRVASLGVFSSKIVEDEAVRVVGVGGRADDGGDLDGEVGTLFLGQGDTESTGDEAATDPGAEDIAEVERDLAIGVPFNLNAGVDEGLDGGGVDARDGGKVEDDGAQDRLALLLFREDDVPVSWSGRVPGTSAERGSGQV